MSTRFSIGDRVRVISDEFFPGLVGCIGTVSEDDGSGLPYSVEFEDGDVESEWYRAQELERIADSAGTVYVAQIPDEPVGVTQVRPVGSDDDPPFEKRLQGAGKPALWVRNPGERGYEWETLLRIHTKGVEVVDPRSEAEREYDVSLDYLRRNPHVLAGLAEYSVTGSHAAAVVRGVLAGE